MGFLFVQPEVAGASVSQSRTSGVCVFDTWLGDDLIRVHPLFLVTTPLKRALAALQDPTGFEFARARVRSSLFFRSHTERRLPRFWHFRAEGVPGQDDAAVTGDGSLVVSQRVLDVFMEFKIGRAVFAQYPR